MKKQSSRLISIIRRALTLSLVLSVAVQTAAPAAFWPFNSYSYYGGGYSPYYSSYYTGGYSPYYGGYSPYYGGYIPRYYNYGYGASNYIYPIIMGATLLGTAGIAALAYARNRSNNANNANAVNSYNQQVNANNANAANAYNQQVAAYNNNAIANYNQQIAWSQSRNNYSGTPLTAYQSGSASWVPPSQNSDPFSSTISPVTQAAVEPPLAPPISPAPMATPMGVASNTTASAKPPKRHLFNKAKREKEAQAYALANSSAGTNSAAMPGSGSPLNSGFIELVNKNYHGDINSALKNDGMRHYAQAIGLTANGDNSPVKISSDRTKAIKQILADQSEDPAMRIQAVRQILNQPVQTAGTGYTQ